MFAVSLCEQFSQPPQWSTEGNCGISKITCGMEGIAFVVKPWKVCCPSSPWASRLFRPQLKLKTSHGVPVRGDISLRGLERLERSCSSSYKLELPGRVIMNMNAHVSRSLILCSTEKALHNYSGHEIDIDLP